MSMLIIKQGLNKLIFSRNIRRRRVEYFAGKSLSIISSNCIGGIIYYDQGISFESPTINISFSPDNYIKFAQKLKYYLSQDLKFYEFHSSGYPICKLDDIFINFVHYNSFDECIEKWNKRKSRVNFDNILLIFTDQDGCTSGHVDKFSKLKYNKVFFTTRDDNEYDFEIKVNKSKDDLMTDRNPIDNLFHYNGLSGKRVYEKYFNLIDFFNSIDR